MATKGAVVLPVRLMRKLVATGPVSLPLASTAALRAGRGGVSLSAVPAVAVALLLLARKVLLLLPLSRIVTVPLAPAGLATLPVMAPVLIVNDSLSS